MRHGSRPCAPRPISRSGTPEISDLATSGSPRMTALPDVLAEDLAAVFCATAAGEGSWKLEAYYAGRGNKFWLVLHGVGLTSRQLRPEEYNLVLAYDIGLTDLVRTRAGMD